MTRGYHLLGKNKLKNLEVEKVLDLHVDSNLTFEKHIALEVKKANSIIALIRKSFVQRSPVILKQLVTSLVRPHVEHCNQICYPRLKKHIKVLENVLRRLTRVAHGFDASYQERLKKLKLPAFKQKEKRRHD